jgi:hypothetical protein
MALPNCRNCGSRLTTLTEINGYNGYCNDCHKKNMSIAGWTQAGIYLLLALLAWWIFF